MWVWGYVVWVWVYVVWVWGYVVWIGKGDVDSDECMWEKKLVLDGYLDDGVFIVINGIGMGMDRIIISQMQSLLGNTFRREESKRGTSYRNGRLSKTLLPSVFAHFWGATWISRFHFSDYLLISYRPQQASIIPNYPPVTTNSIHQMEECSIPIPSKSIKTKRHALIGSFWIHAGNTCNIYPVTQLLIVCSFENG